MSRVLPRPIGRLVARCWRAPPWWEPLVDFVVEYTHTHTHKVCNYAIVSIYDWHNSRWRGPFYFKRRNSWTSRSVHCFRCCTTAVRFPFVAFDDPAVEIRDYYSLGWKRYSITCWKALPLLVQRSTTSGGRRARVGPATDHRTQEIVTYGASRVSLDRDVNCRAAACDFFFLFLSLSLSLLASISRCRVDYNFLLVVLVSLVAKILFK